MGLKDLLKGQFIDVIEWTDNSSDTMVYRFERQGNEIKMGAQLTVRESQAAVFVNEGQIADVFTPGRYELSTQNLPILTTLKAWKYGFNSPFKAEVYFVNTKQFTDQKWGTSNPIMLRDAEFGPVRIRGYGIYTYRVSDPAIFMKEVFGTNDEFSTEDIEGQLRRQLVSGLTDIIAESKIAVLDLAQNYDEFGATAVEAMQPKFSMFGLKLVSLTIENISLPEAVEKAIDQRSTMGVLGDMNKYTQYKTAEAIGDAAKNEGGMVGAGMGIGVGAGFGNIMGQAMAGAAGASNNNQQQAQPQAKCIKCNMPIAAGAKFCNHCGAAQTVPKKKCIKCNAEIPADAKFCVECGTPQTAPKCSKCGAEVPAGTKFCPECGNKM